MSLNYKIVCDGLVVRDGITHGCGKYDEMSSKTTSGQRMYPHNLRARLQEHHGWRQGEGGGEDYCPECWQKKKENK